MERAHDKLPYRRNAFRLAEIQIDVVLVGRLLEVADALIVESRHGCRQIAAVQRA